MADCGCGSCGGHCGEDGRLTLEATIHGKGPYRLFVDTGAGRTVVAHDVAREANLDLVGHEIRRGVGGETRVDLTAPVPIVVDGRKVDLDSLGVSDVPHRLCGDVAGVVGYDVLRSFLLTIEYATGRASLLTQSLDSHGVPFFVANGRKPLLLVDVEIAGAGQVLFALDTGAGGTVISPALASRLGLARGDDVTCVGVGGPAAAFVAGSPINISIGTVTASVSPVVLDVFEMLSQDTGRAIDGLIGHDVLSRQSLSIDYPRGMLRLG